MVADQPVALLLRRGNELGQAAFASNDHGRASLAQGRAQRMDARVDQRRAGHLGFVAHLVAGVVGEGAHQGVLGPVLVDGPGVLDGHRLPGQAAVVAGEPLQGGATGDLHLHIGFGRFHTLGQLVLAGQVGPGGLVEVAHQVDVAKVDGRSVVGKRAAQAHADLDPGGEVGQPFLLGGNHGVPGHAAVGGVFPVETGTLGDGRVFVEVDVGELHAGDRLKANHPLGLEVVAVDLHRQVGAVERRPGLGVGALQQHAFHVGLPGDDAPAAHLAQGGGAHLVIGAVGQQHHGIAGVGLGVERVVEANAGLAAQADLVRGQHFLGEHHAVGQTGGDAANLHRDRNARVPGGELQSDAGNHLVLGEAESLGQRIAGHEDGLGAPDHLHHGHADDAVLDDALDAGDDQRIVDLQAGPGRVDAVGHLHDAVAVAGVGRDGEGGADPTGLVADQVAGHHLAVAAQYDAGFARGEVDAGDGDAGLAAPPEVGRDLQHGRGLVEHGVGVDVPLLGPVVLFHQHGLVARQQCQAAEEARVAARLIDREHRGVRNAVRRDETGDLVDSVRNPRSEFMLKEFEDIVQGQMQLPDGNSYGFVSELNDLQKDILSILNVPLHYYDYQHLIDSS